MDCLKQTIPDDSMIETTPECKSWVASRFTVVEEAGVFKRRCKYADCNKEYSRGTSHMILKRHWSRAHADIFSLSPRSRAMLGNSPGQVTPKLPPIKKKKSPLKVSNSCPTGGTACGATRGKNGNQNISSNTPSSGNKLTNNDRNHQFDVKQVAKRLREATSIHLTFDIHTPKKGGKTFGIITAHSLSDSLDIRSVLLEYRHLPYPDDSTSIYEFLRSCITKFNCREKIISVASNGSDMVASAVQEFDKRYRLSKNFNFSTIHIKCFPQFVHLNVIDVLRSQESLINGIRKIVSFINNNNFTMRPLQQSNSQDPSDGTPNGDVSNTSVGNTESETRATGLKLPLDNRNSWNTTFNMIDTFLQQRGFIEPTLLYFQNTQDLTNIAIDWDRLFTLVQLLKPFYDVINKFATDNYTPVSSVAACIPHLMDHLSNSSWGYEDLAMAAHQFKMQLDTYRQFFQSDLTVIAGLLDPRIKDTFTSPEGKTDVINILRKRLGDPSVPIKTTDGRHYPESSLWSQVFRPHNYDEVLDYLESPREHGYTCSVAYWEAHKHVYPTLYGLARTLACVQATSVPSDRMFSAAENADRERKIQVESTNSKELMKSWAKYLEK